MADVISQILVKLDATTAGLTAAFNEAKHQTESFKEDLESLKHIAETVFAFEAAKKGIEVIKEVSEAFGELAENGHRLQGIAEGFEQLGGTAASLNAAREATLGMVDSTTLMLEENKGLFAQGPAFDRYFGDITKLATAYAESTGTKIPVALDKLIKALDTGSSKGLAQFGIQLDSGITKAQKTVQGFAKLAEAAAALGPPTEDAGTAFEALSTALGTGQDGVWGKLALGVNSSSELKKAYKELTETLKLVDWKELGKEAGDAFAAILEAANEYIVPAARVFKQFAEGIGASFGSGLLAQVNQTAKAIADLKEGLASGDIANSGSASVSRLPYWMLSKDTLKQADDAAAAATKSAQDKLTELESHLNDLTNQYYKTQKAATETGDSGADAGSKPIPPLKAQTQAADDLGKAHEKVAEKIAKENAELSKMKDQGTADLIKKNITEALSLGNIEGAKALVPAYDAAMSKVADDQIAKMSLADPVIAEQYKQIMMDKANTEIADDIKKKTEAAFQESVQFWESAVDGMWNNATEYLKSALKSVVTGFIAEMLAGMTGLSIKGGFSGLGQSIAGNLFGFPTGGNGIASIAGLLGAGSGVSGVGPIADGAAYGAALSANTAAITAGTTATGGLSAGLAGLGPYVVAAAGAYEAGKSWYEKDGGNRVLGTSGGAAKGGDYLNTGLDVNPMTMWVNPVLGALGLPNVGQMLGLSGGKPNSDTQALMGIQQLLAQRTGQNFDGFQNSHQFNPGGSGFANLQKGSAREQQGFGALGTELQALSGTTKEVGGQIAAILDTDLSGSIDKARLLTQKLGISQQQMMQDVVAAGVRMGKTWQQIAGDVSGVNDLFAKGLAKQGDLKGVEDELAQSGNVGQQALKGIADLAVEAGEKGVKDLAGLKTQLTGIWDPKDVQALFGTLSAVGIKSMSQLTNMSQEMEIQILGMLQTLGFGFNKLTNDANGTADAVSGVGTAATDATSGGGALEAHAKGGIVTRPTVFQSGIGRLGLMGESGPEAILPLSRASDGSLGVHASGMASKTGGVTIYVHAPGATEGAAESIKHMLESMSQNIVQQAVQETMSAFARGTGGVPWQ